MMGDRHTASPNSEVSGTVTPDSQNATSTVPEQLAKLKNGATTGGSNAEQAKVVSGGNAHQ